ncbi:hypothetical protein C8F04DRAFT_1263642 [Mycena alexandri]|uniref:Uncharacterized protein n=1 Tax=Mycena alexandri TaxID=1745969 RepID=A0AAD6SNZ9_9AGAR|nr:hypothetical protein C8F04DRAFT_1263642 [Mycena alexandri]
MNSFAHRLANLRRSRRQLSGLSSSSRYDIKIGARSSATLPFPDLRIISPRKPPSPTGKLKSPPHRLFVTAANIVFTSLTALKESADAFPPLKSAVGAVLALWEIAERAESSKSDAHDIVLRAKTVLDVIADAVPNPSSISEPMRRSIDCFTALAFYLTGSRDPGE